MLGDGTANGKFFQGKVGALRLMQGAFDVVPLEFSAFTSR